MFFNWINKISGVTVLIWLAVHVSRSQAEQHNWWKVQYTAWWSALLYYQPMLRTRSLCMSVSFLIITHLFLSLSRDCTEAPMVDGLSQGLELNIVYLFIVLILYTLHGMILFYTPIFRQVNRNRFSLNTIARGCQLQ